MWVYTTHGFFSAVVLQQDDTQVMVRARAFKDIESLCKDLKIPLTHISKTPNADYGFRIVMSRDRWSQWLDMQTRRMDYGNFKSAVAQVDTERAHGYHDVWWATIKATVPGLEGMADEHFMVNPECPDPLY
jgi:hypothetical protein